MIPLLVAFLVGQDPQILPAPNPAWNTITLKDGRKVVLMPRHQLRAKSLRTLSLPVLEDERAKLPPPPTSVDWTMGDKIPLPILGNDRYGDCYAVAPAHQATMFGANVAGNVNGGIVWNQTQLLAWYRKASGGDNGLGDSDVFPALRAGFIPPGGPYKVYDILITDPTNLNTIKLATQLFGPPMWTCSLLDTWENKTAPGDLWDDVGNVDPNGGHAMVFGSVDPNGQMQTKTWGIEPSIQVTYKGFLKAQPEIIFCFSPLWFNAAGYAPNGLHYTTLAGYWVAMGGAALPPSPFPGPAPPPIVTITLSPSTLLAATVGTPYLQTITASGGTAPYTFSVTAGALPAGLALAGGGVLSGTPTTAGASNFNVTARDSAAHSGTATYVISVSAVNPSPPPVVATYDVLDLNGKLVYRIVPTGTVPNVGELTAADVQAMLAAPNGLAIVADVFALLKAVKAKDQSAILAAVMKLLTDLGVTLPVAAPASSPVAPVPVVPPPVESQGAPPKKLTVTWNHETLRLQAASRAADEQVAREFARLGMARIPAAVVAQAAPAAVDDDLVDFAASLPSYFVERDERVARAAKLVVKVKP